MTKKSKLVKYVHEHLPNEFRAVGTGTVGSAESGLSLEERTLIYKYSEDGYEGVNRSLRNSSGQTHTQLGELVEIALNKLPDYRGLVYRSANLNVAQLDRYIQAFNKNTILVNGSLNFAISF
jgi:hypothetical protein